MQGIVRRFPGVLANDHVDLTVAAGEVHAVMGENGAGKSTLMEILFGLQAPDSGSIVLDGTAVRFGSPLDAIAHGIGMVHQGFRLFEQLSVWENVVYGSEPRRGPFVDRAAAISAVSTLATRHGMPIDPLARVADLPVGVRQRLEILKALYRRVRILILDEPTAVLSPIESAGLFRVIRALAADGCAILLVTHKLAEVMAASDRVTVLRDGRVTARLATAETDAGQIIHAMTGRNLSHLRSERLAPPGATRLSVRHLVVWQGTRRVVQNLDFDVRRGEVVGIAGVAGNGQTALVEALVGLAPATGRVALDGVAIERMPVAARRRAGIGYIAEDRQRTATAPGASVQDNLAMGYQRTPPLHHLLLSPRRMGTWARGLIAKFDIRVAGPWVRVHTLSGGNAQKLVVARELAREAALVIAEQPTRGVDVGAIAFIHAELFRARDRGQAVLLISSEMSEILALSDRILVMFDGRIVGEVPRAEASETELGLLMAGGERRAA
jgi:ABC-type uncharacterized transport system ATPase subunit